MQYTYMYFIIIYIVFFYKIVLFNAISYLYSNQVFINYLNKLDLTILISDL